jgi:hypothetical protein
MGGVADRSFHRADLAPVELERDIALRLRPDRRRVRQNSVRDRDHRRQRRIVDDDGLGGIARGLGAVRNHESDRLADIANDLARQRVTGRHHQRRCHRNSGHRARQRSDIVGGQFSSREHGRNAGHFARRIDADRGDPRMRMRRTNDGAMQRVWRHEIGDVAPASPHEALVFKAVDAASPITARSWEAVWNPTAVKSIGSLVSLPANRSTPSELQFQQGKSLQDGGIALAAMGRAQDRFGDGLNVTGMNRLGKRGHRGIKRDFHHRDHLGRKRRIGKILHDGPRPKGAAANPSWQRECNRQPPGV